MNQKQRNLLCDMLSERVEKVRREITDHFQAQRGPQLWPRSLWDDKERDMPSSLASEYNDLHKQARTLQVKFEKLRQKLTKMNDKAKERESVVREKLETSQRDAVIKIQFAEDAATAQSFIDSIPSVESLLG